MQADSTVERLAKLKQLLDANLITQAEFDQRRERILDEI
jgi:hypothetical protein